MGLILKQIGYRECDYPISNNSYFRIEHNIGDDFPIHIHWAQKKPNKEIIRIHFTYKQFENFKNKILNAGKI